MDDAQKMKMLAKFLPNINEEYLQYTTLVVEILKLLDKHNPQPVTAIAAVDRVAEILKEGFNLKMKEDDARQN